MTNNIEPVNLNEKGNRFENKAIISSQFNIIHSELEKELLILLNTVTDSAFLIDRQGIVILINQTGASRLNLKPEDITGKSIFDFLPSHVSSSRREKVNEAINKKIPVHFSDIRDDIYFEHSVYPIQNSNGDIFRLAIFGKDISNYVKAREELQKSNDRYKILSEITSDVAVCLKLADDGNFFIEWETESFNKFYENNSNNTYSFDSWFKLVHPDDKKILFEIREKLFSGEEVKSELRIITEENEVKWISATIFPKINIEGDLIGIISSIKDITERKTAEEALKESRANLSALIENTCDIIWSIDTDQRLITGNSNFMKFAVEYFEYKIEKGDKIFQNNLKKTKREVWEKLLEKAANGIYFITEINIEIKNERKIYELSFNPIKVTGSYLIGSSIFQRDVTAIKEYQKKIIDSEHNYKLIIENQNDLIIKVDNDLRLTYINPKFSDVFGKPIDEILGKQFISYIHDDDKNAVRISLSNLYRHPYQTQHEDRALTVRGWRWFFWRAKSIRDYKGSVVGFVAVGRDITDRKEMESALLKNEYLLKESQMLAHVGSYDLDFVNNGVFWTEETYRILDFDPNEPPPSSDEYMKYVHPEDIDKLNQALTDSIVNKKPFDLEYRIFTKKGIEKIVLSKGEIVCNSAGEVTNLIGSYQDITDIKRSEKSIRESEARYKLLAENNEDFIWTTDNNLFFSYVNPIAYKFTGYSEAELLKMKVQDLMTMESRNRLRDIFYKKRMEWEHNFNDESGIRFEYELVKKDDLKIWVETLSKPIKDNKKNIIGLNGITRNINERKIAESKLKDYTKELKMLNEDKNKFFSVIAHDLKSPFQSLLGFSELLKNEMDNLSKEEIKYFLNENYETSKNIFNLVDNLLNWSRLQTGKIEFSPENFNIKDEIDEIINLLQRQSFSKKINVNNNIKKNLIIYADKNMIRSVLQNLISNAIKFTYANGNINIFSKSNDNMNEICVEDDGVGLSKEELNRLFKIDKSFTKTGTSNEKGTGLGLLICKELVENCGGKIKVESEEGKGTRFCFTVKKKHK